MGPIIVSRFRGYKYALRGVEQCSRIDEEAYCSSLV